MMVWEVNLEIKISSDIITNVKEKWKNGALKPSVCAAAEHLYPCVYIDTRDALK